MQGFGLASLPGFARRAWDVTAGEPRTRIGRILYGMVLPTEAVRYDFHPDDLTCIFVSGNTL
jgi:hypothetical protein